MEQKQEKQKVEVIQPKLCPLISGFLLEPIKSALGQMQVAKTTNVAPCIEDKCKFYDEQDKDCLLKYFIVHKKIEGKI